MCRCVPESGLAKPVPAQWVNDSGRVAHPDSPLGRGGPGNFRAAGVFGAGYSDDEEAKKVVRQPGPKVSADAADEVLHKVLTLKLKADQSKAAGISGAETKFATVASGKISSKRDEAGKVTSFTHGASWTLTLRTRYGTGTPDSDSAYGRGTTVSDVQSGQVTLGFHEACHRDTMLAYFRTTAPPTFDGAVGDTGDEFDAKLATFMTAVDAYFEAARTKNIDEVDEVGKPTMSQYFAKSE